jgi:putative transposase
MACPRLILAGVAVGYLMSTVNYYLESLAAPNQLSGVLFWLLGSVSRARWPSLGLPSVVVVVSTTWLILQGRRLNAPGIVNLAGWSGCGDDRRVGPGWGGAGFVGGVAPSYKGFRYPVEIIRHCVWLYHRFPLSFREVEEMMMERGRRGLPRDHPAVVCEVRADLCQRASASPGTARGQVAPDEVFIKINKKIHYLWRAVDQHGNVLDILVQSRRNTTAAKKFFRRLLKGLEYVPRVVVTDKLASYGAARRIVMHSVEHRKSKYLNNRAENSHQPTRARERAMKRFTSPRHAQRFLSAFSSISPHFRARRHRLSATEYRREMTVRFATWNEVTGLNTAA